MQVSQSQVKCFKQCRRLYYLSYVQGLKYSGSIAPLETGSSYHDKLEQLYKNGSFEPTGDKTDAMAWAYEKYIYPKVKAKVAEQWFEKELTPKCSLIGRVDAVAEDGLLVEHKTTSGSVGEDYVYRLQWDEQVLFYMLANGVNEMYYTVCRKPTIRQKANESEEEFIERCKAWYDEDTDEKIRTFKVIRNKDEIKEYRKELVKTVSEMRSCKLFYKNTAHCSCWGRMCEYSSICLNYDPSFEYVDFTKTNKEERKILKGEEENGLY